MEGGGQGSQWPQQTNEPPSEEVNRRCFPAAAPTVSPSNTQLLANMCVTNVTSEPMTESQTLPCGGGHTNIPHKHSVGGAGVTNGTWKLIEFVKCC